MQLDLLQAGNLPVQLRSAGMPQTVKPTVLDPAATIAGFRIRWYVFE